MSSSRSPEGEAQGLLRKLTEINNSTQEIISQNRIQAAHAAVTQFIHFQVNSAVEWDYAPYSTSKRVYTKEAKQQLMDVFRETLKSLTAPENQNRLDNLHQIAAFFTQHCSSIYSQHDIEINNSYLENKEEIDRGLETQTEEKTDHHEYAELDALNTIDITKTRFYQSRKAALQAETPLIDDLAESVIKVSVNLSTIKTVVNLYDARLKSFTEQSGKEHAAKLISFLINEFKHLEEYDEYCLAVELIQDLGYNVDELKKITAKQFDVIKICTEKLKFRETIENLQPLYRLILCDYLLIDEAKELTADQLAFLNVNKISELIFTQRLSITEAKEPQRLNILLNPMIHSYIMSNKLSVAEAKALTEQEEQILKLYNIHALIIFKFLTIEEAKKLNETEANNLNHSSVYNLIQRNKLTVSEAKELSSQMIFTLESDHILDLISAEKLSISQAKTLTQVELQAIKLFIKEINEDKIPITELIGLTEEQLSLLQVNNIKTLIINKKLSIADAVRLTEPERSMINALMIQITNDKVMLSEIKGITEDQSEQLNHLVDMLYSENYSSYHPIIKLIETNAMTLSDFKNLTAAQIQIVREFERAEWYAIFHPGLLGNSPATTFNMLLQPIDVGALEVSLKNIGEKYFHKVGRFSIFYNANEYIIAKQLFKYLPNFAEYEAIRVGNNSSHYDELICQKDFKKLLLESLLKIFNQIKPNSDINNIAQDIKKALIDYPPFKELMTESFSSSAKLTAASMEAGFTTMINKFNEALAARPSPASRTRTNP